MTTKHHPSAFRLRPLRCIIAISITLASLTATAQITARTPAAAEAGVARAWNLPVAPLADTLAHIARDSGYRLSADPALVAGKTAAAVHGNLSAIDAVRQALVGTGLKLVVTEGGTLSVQPAPASSSSPVTTLAEMTVTGAAINSGVTEGTGSYTTNQSSYGKGQTLKELPQTVTVMTNQRIQDQRLFTMDDVMAYTPGVTVERSDSNGGKGAFYSRGFQITNILLDGNSSIVAGGNSPGGPTNSYSVGTLDMAIFDSIEVLRGSNALYGVTAGAPGGAINLVRKRPTKVFQLNAQASAGSWSNYRGELDVGGPVALDGRIRGRLVGVYQDGNSFINYSDSNKKLFYGIVEADITNSTLLTIGGHIQWDNDGYIIRSGLPRYSNGDDLGLPRSTYLGTSADRYKRNDNNLFIRLDQKIGADWGLSIEGVRGKYDYSARELEWLGLIDPITNGGRTAAAALTDSTGTNKALDVTLKGSFQLFGRKHGVTLGANYNKNNESVMTIYRGNRFGIPNILAYDPNSYSNLYNEYTRLVFPANRYSKQKGLYGSLAMKITDPLTLIVGGRFSWYEFDYMYTFYDASGKPDDSYHSAVKDNKVFTPYIGLTFDLPKNWSIYASIAETYTPESWGLKGPLPGTPLDPVTGRTYEIGTKGGLFDDRLNLSLALYRIKNNGVTSYDPNYPDSIYAETGRFCCYLNDGTQISQGVDIEVSGEII